jgi:hypothetical protein
MVNVEITKVVMDTYVIPLDIGTGELILTIPRVSLPRGSCDFHAGDCVRVTIKKLKAKEDARARR